MLQPIPNFVGETGPQSLLDRDSSLTVNLYVQAAEAGENPKTAAALVSTPGMQYYVNFTDNGTWGYGAFTCCTVSFTAASTTQGERTFFITGRTPNGGGNSHLIEITGFSELSQTGSYQNIATLPNSFFGTYQQWKIVPTNNQLFISGNGGAVVYNAGNNTVTDITSFGGTFPGAIDATYQDGYVLCIPPASQRLYASVYQDARAWDALDYVLMNDVPDSLVAVRSYNRLIHVFGQYRTEVFENSGAPNFPFTRVSSAGFPVGCVHANTVQIAGTGETSSLIFMGRDALGGAGIYRISGFNHRKVSTTAMDRVFQKANVQNDLEGGSLTSTVFRWNGQDLYAISIVNNVNTNTTFLYNVTSDTWSNWSWGGSPYFGNIQTSHQVVCATYNRRLGKVLVGTRSLNTIYSLEDVPTDAGAGTIWRFRAFPHQGGFGRRQFFSNFIIDGTPTSSYFLQWNDVLSGVAPGAGQVAYSPFPYAANPGAELPGNRIQWTRLGSAYNDRVWQLWIQDGSVSPTVLNAALLDVK